jgi:hypothetical protein
MRKRKQKILFIFISILIQIFSLCDGGVGVTESPVGHARACPPPKVVKMWLKRDFFVVVKFA